MTAQPLVLSLFPGIGLLDMAFELEGFCVVRGPDLLWGGDIKRFHVPAGRFEGVIGGPPCKAFSGLTNIVRARYGEASVAENLIPEFERIVDEARPEWFIMENVIGAPSPHVFPFAVSETILNNRWLGEAQNRLRRFSFGVPNTFCHLRVEQSALESATWEPAVTSTAGGRRAVAVRDANGRVRGKQGAADCHRLRGRSIEKMAELQGLPLDFLKDSPLTSSGKRGAIGNGVPLPMGRAIAKAVKAAMYPDSRVGAA